MWKCQTCRGRVAEACLEFCDVFHRPFAVAEPKVRRVEFCISLSYTALPELCVNLLLLSFLAFTVFWGVYRVRAYSTKIVPSFSIYTVVLNFLFLIYYIYKNKKLLQAFNMSTKETKKVIELFCIFIRGITFWIISPSLKALISSNIYLVTKLGKNSTKFTNS